MNLRNLANGATSAINPNISVSVRRSTGYTTSDSGKRAPAYAAAVSVLAQIQALSFDDLKLLDGLQVQGERHAIYLNGNFNGVSRPLEYGGDLIAFPDNSVWLVVMISENWSITSGWTKVLVTRQND